MSEDVPLPEPLDYCYEWDGPYGTRKFSTAQHNGRKPDRSVALFTATQLRAYGDAREAAGVARERAKWEDALKQTWQMIDPLQPAGQPGSYARGQDSGITAALQTLRQNIDAAIRKGE